MAIALFSASANPKIDEPMWFVDKKQFHYMLEIGAIQKIDAPGHKRAAQYLSNRPNHIPTPAVIVPIKPEYRPDTFGPHWTWGTVGTTRQMVDTMSGASHFGQTRNGMNFAPNKTTSPCEHIDIGAR